LENFKYNLNLARLWLRGSVKDNVILCMCAWLVGRAR
jgi:hypothetical protein